MESGTAGTHPPEEQANYETENGRELRGSALDSKDDGGRAVEGQATKVLSRPILMMHFPLYRQAESLCHVQDGGENHTNRVGMSWLS